MNRAQRAEEERRLRIAEYGRYKRAVRRAWLLIGFRAVAGGAGALAGRMVADRLGWHVPLWAALTLLAGRPW